LLQRHSGHGKGRLHDGKVVVMRSNAGSPRPSRTICWNGDIVRIFFVIDAHDREALGWMRRHAAAGDGINGSMVCDLMVEAVEPERIVPRAATATR
jgi:putative transposase